MKTASQNRPCPPSSDSSSSPLYIPCPAAPARPRSLFQPTRYNRGFFLCALAPWLCPGSSLHVSDISFFGRTGSPTSDELAEHLTSPPPRIASSQHQKWYVCREFAIFSATKLFLVVATRYFDGPGPPSGLGGAPSPRTRPSNPVPSTPTPAKPEDASQSFLQKLFTPWDDVSKKTASTAIYLLGRTPSSCQP